MINKKNMSSLERQVDAIFRHSRQGSYDTRFRYRDSARLFARFANEKFKLQNARNLADKHLIAFIRHRQNQGVAPKTLKNDLAAIRYMHSQVAKRRYDLASNEVLKSKYGINLDPTPEIHGNRAWTEEEYIAMKELAVSLGRQKEVDIMTLCRTMGLRIAEASAATRAQAEAGLRTGKYQVLNEAKGGKHRIVPLSDEAKEVFERLLLSTPRGHRLFVDYENGGTVHKTIMNAINFVSNHRSKIVTNAGIKLRTWKDKNGIVRTWDLTLHGLRYSYIQDRIKQEINKGFSIKQAYATVTKEVGHERISAINIYTGGKTLIS